MSQIKDLDSLDHMSATLKKAVRLLQDSRIIGQSSDDKEVYWLSLLVEAQCQAANVLQVHLDSILRRSGYGS